MMRIKIVVGSYGYRKSDTSPVELIDKNSEPIDVSVAEAERLIGLGIAEEVSYTEPVVDETETPVTGHLDVEALKDYTVPELRALAKDLGLKTGGTKDELIERITAVEVGIPSEDEAVVTEDETEEPPVLEAADPE